MSEEIAILASAWFPFVPWPVGRVSFGGADEEIFYE